MMLNWLVGGAEPVQAGASLPAGPWRVAPVGGARDAVDAVPSAFSPSPDTPQASPMGARPARNAVAESTWHVRHEAGRILVDADGEVGALYPVEGCPLQDRCVAPELLEPTYVIIGATSIHWLEQRMAGAGAVAEYYVVSQGVDAANGAADGVLRVMVFEQEGGGGGGGRGASVVIDMTSPVWAACAVRQSMCNPWWGAVHPKQPPALEYNLSLPAALRTTRLSRCTSVWSVNEGWLSTSYEIYSVTLLQNTLFFAAAPNCTDDDLMQYELVHASVAAGEPIEVSGTPRYPIRIDQARVSSYEPITFLLDSARERALWVALLDISIHQLSKARTLPAATAAAYEATLTRTRVPLSLPSIRPSKAPETLADCRRAGWVSVVGDNSGGWFGGGTQTKLFLTVHDAFVSARVQEDSLEGCAVLALAGARVGRVGDVARGGAGGEGASDSWRFRLTSPFEAPIEVACGSERELWAWLRALHDAICGANREDAAVATGAGRAVRVRRVGAVSDIAASSGTPAAAPPAHVVVCPHGIGECDVTKLPYAQESPWRQLLAPHGLIGSEHRGSRFCGESNDIEWVPAAPTSTLPPAVDEYTPVHVVVPGKRCAEVLEAPSIPADCLLPEKRVLEASAITEAVPESWRPVSCTGARLPVSTEYTLAKAADGQWLMVLSGVLRVLVFPRRCYALLGHQGRVVNHPHRIPVGWGRSGEPLAHLGGQQLIVKAGEAVYIPAGCLMTYKALAATDLLRCQCRASIDG